MLSHLSHPSYEEKRLACVKVFAEKNQRISKFLSEDHSSEFYPEVMNAYLDFLLCCSKIINQNNVRLTISLIRGTITVGFMPICIFVDISFDDNTSQVSTKIRRIKLLDKESLKPVRYHNNRLDTITIFLTIDEFTQYVTK